MSVLLLGEKFDDEIPASQRELYVLTRSFEARDQHLRELEAFRAQLPGYNAVQFLPDPLSTTLPSYHAAMPYEVRLWVESRQEVVEARRFRNPNGLDQYDGPKIGSGYVEPDVFWVTCRNREQREKHIAELVEFAGARCPQTPLNLSRKEDKINLPRQYELYVAGYYARLLPEILEWVKGRDEVIRIAPELWDALCNVEEPDSVPAFVGLFGGSSSSRA
ncbi:hypothetical protein B0H13DRAFT_2319710 [Mycena leptocephala]|nr:hypothetical protein B0H13DRAFT_2319710 [Mycena leptocephala]